MTCAVLVPQGKIAHRQAGPGAGARGQAAPGRAATSTTAWSSPASCRPSYPVAAGQLGQPGPDPGAEDRRVRDRRRARRRARRALPAGRQRRQHHRLLDGLPASTCATGGPRRPPRMFGFQAAARRRSSTASRCGSRRPSPPRSASATRPRGGRPSTPATSPAALIHAVTDRRDPGRLPAPGPRRRRCSSSRPRAASVAGLLQSRDAGLVPAGPRVVCTVTGNGLKDPDWAHLRRPGARHRSRSTPAPRPPPLGLA